jgi:hypothetical protein
MRNVPLACGPAADTEALRKAYNVSLIGNVARNDDDSGTEPRNSARFNH